MPDIYLITFITVGGFFLAVLGLLIRLSNKVASLEKDLFNLTSHVRDLEVEVAGQRIKRESDNDLIWKEISEVRRTVTKVATLLETHILFIQESLRRHDSSIEKMEQKLKD